MRKIVIILLGFVSVVLFYFTAVTAGKTFRSDWQLPPAIENQIQESSRYRLVLITQELETPFWDQVGKGAIEQATQEGASLEVWGSYGKNQEEFLKQIEIAIYSKVDGMIVQGLDTEAFKKLTKVKAAFYGIPIITVANDVPMEESSRRTYVGSDHYLAGKMIAKQLIIDMDQQGTVILMSSNQQEFFQKQRLNGVQDVLKEYPNIQTINAETTDTKEQVITTTQDILNQYPDVNGFITVNANIAGAMIEEIGRRSLVEPYHIYSFDDGSESLQLYQQGKLDGIIEQSPEMMGKMSVNLMLQWLDGETIPLDMNGYFTDIRMLKAMDKQ